eukprot:SAG11_NODE_319_length_10822_cov_12.319500_10_plen_87_part_00
MFGEHEQSCKSHNRNLRHNNILDALISVARTVGVSANRDQVLPYIATPLLIVLAQLTVEVGENGTNRFLVLLGVNDSTSTGIGYTG